MNIFVLHKQVDMCARMLCDKHVVKMVLETAQILSSAQRINGNEDEKLYKLTHKGHPCVKWASENRGNYIWLYNYFLALCKEYEYRYKKIHKSESLKYALADFSFIPFFSLYPSFNFNCTNNDIKDIVMSYREYYRYKKKEIDMKWTVRNMPFWLTY